MRYYLLFFLAFILLASKGKSDNYEIKVKLANCKESKIFLAYYYEDKVFVIDTARTNINGKAIFSKKEKLHGGLYLLYLPSKKYFDFIIGKDQHFSIEADAADLNKDIIIKHSDESMAFREYQLFMKKKRKEKSLLLNKLKELKKLNNTEKLSSCKNKIEILDTQVREYILNLTKQFPSSALSGFVNLTIGPDIPDFTKRENDIPKSDKEKIKELYYNYNRKHFWDNVNFSDSTILRTPIFKKKLDLYFNRILILNPDTVLNESIKIIEKTGDNKTMFRYMVSYCFNYSLNSKIMGMDGAFVGIARRYYLSGKATWVNAENIVKIKEEVENTENNILGLRGKEMKLPTIDDEWVSLHETEAELTILLFWEPNCGHCKKIIPKIKKQLYDKYKGRGLKVFAVYTQKDRNEWEEFVEEYELFDFINCFDPHNQTNFRQNYNVYNTPVIYVLNRQKEIIAKKVDVKTIEIIIKEELKK